MKHMECYMTSLFLPGSWIPHTIDHCQFKTDVLVVAQTEILHLQVQNLHTSRFAHF